MEIRFIDDYDQEVFKDPRIDKQLVLDTLLALSIKKVGDKSVRDLGGKEYIYNPYKTPRIIQNKFDNTLEIEYYVDFYGFSH